MIILQIYSNILKPPTFLRFLFYKATSFYLASVISCTYIAINGRKQRLGTQCVPNLLAKLLLHIEARAILGGKLVVAMNCRLGIFLLQLFNERFQRRLLLGGSGVLRLAILGKPADVAYSDAHGVVSLTVGANFLH